MTKKIALKPYLEQIETYCDGLTRLELITLLMNLAIEVPIDERQTFLDRLQSLPLSAMSPDDDATLDDDEAEAIKEDILDDIEALKEEIEGRIESIEDGTYWETAMYEEKHYHHEDYGWDSYDDENPDYVSEDQYRDLANFFEQAGQFFLEGEIQLAHDVYERLFQLFEEIDELDFELHEKAPTIDLRESRARYCRCVYMTSDKKERVSNMESAVALYATINSEKLKLSNEKHPMLQDILDSGTGDFEDWGNFLEGWQKMLEDRQSKRAATLLLEVTEMRQGVKGVAKLARKWGEKEPRGFIYYIQLLIKDYEDWKSASRICIEALDTFNNDSFREQAAEYLTRCGERLSDPTLVLTGQREKLISSNSITNLLDFLDEATRQGVRESELEALRGIIKKPEDSRFGWEKFYTKFLLISGDLTTALNLVKEAKAVGWSSGDAGLVFSSVLYHIVLDKAQADKAATLHNLLKQYAEGYGGGYSFSQSHRKTPTIYDEIITGLAHGKVTISESKAMWNWANDIGVARIHHIVSNQNRNAYERAAAVLGALSECYILLNQKKEAQALVSGLYADKYRRFSAFRREVKNVFSSSEILKSIRL